MGVLEDAGSVSHETAMEIAQAEYEKYRQKTQDDLSPAERDFLASIRATQKKLEGASRKKKDSEAS